MSQITQVKEANDIIEIIGERLQLQRSGTQWRALCPFHSERSPSFFVSQDMQRYKCFGCGENGDVFTFLEKYEGMTFGESLKMLAERAGIKLESFRPTQDEDQRQQLLEVLNLAKEYFHFLLTKHEAGAVARTYLKERGVTAESVRLFQLGYALPSWDGLIKYLHLKKKYDLAMLEAAGLIIPGKTGRPYDRFRGRLMFPLTNRRGQVVGFSGRVLEKDTKDAKYINSPETMLYHKSEMLYGYSELLQEIRKKREVVVVEGEFDAISSAQAHVNNVVAIKGSALTVQHLQLLSRVADKVLFSLDMDKAGIAATKRAIGLLKGTNLEARVVLAPGGKDPDELARSRPADWREAVKASISIYDYLLQAALKQFDPKTPEGKRAIIDDLAPIFGTISHAVERDVYVKKLAQALEVKEKLVAEDLESFKAGKTSAAQTRKVAAVEEPPEPKSKSRKERLEQYVLHLLVTSPQPQGPLAAELQDIHFESPGAQALVKQLVQLSSQAQTTQALPEDLKQLYFDLSSDPELIINDDRIVWETEWQKALADLKQQNSNFKAEEINQKLAAYDALPELSPEQEAEQTQLLQELVLLKKKVGITSPKV